MRLTDADELREFFFSETSGTKEIISDLMAKHNLDYVNDVNEDEVMDFAKELIENVINVIDTEPTAYGIDKVVEELENKCISPNDYPGYVVDLEKAIEIVEQGVR